MTFNSLQFLIFLPIVVLLYWIVPHKVRWIVLLVASLYAYMSWNVWMVFLIAATVVVSYIMSLITAKTQSRRIKKLCLALTLTVCLGLLVFFKYFNFLFQSVVSFLNLFAMDMSSPALNIILPVGISFYTFQTLSYVIDVYRGKIMPERHFGYYALFVIFFPQLVAGPIERPGDLLPQLKTKQTLNREDMAAGFRWMLSGYIKKCVIADFVGVFVNAVFATYQTANGLAILIAAALFTIQIYCDFAGYSEIAMGAARMMGIRLTRNFDRPFLSLSFSEYIRRWHITLNSWFKDYLYIPLGGSRKGRFRHILNLLIVFAISGLWHGANWTYLLWGVYIGVALVLENLIGKPLGQLFKDRGVNTASVGWILAKRIVFFFLLLPSALLFRAPAVADFGLMFVRIFTGAGFSADYFKAALTSLSMTVLDFIQIILCLVCLYKFYILTTYRNGKQKYPIKNQLSIDGTAAMRYSSYIFLVLAVALAWLILLKGNSSSAFVYFQF